MEYIKEVRFEGKDKGCGNKHDDLVLSGVYLDSDLGIKFKYCNYVSSDFGYSFGVDEKRGGIYISHSVADKGLYFEMKDTPVKGAEYKELLKFKEEIMKEIKGFWKKLANGQENLICIYLGEPTLPFLITTNTLMKNGEYSKKYETAVVYAINKAFEANELPTLGTEYSQVQLELGRILFNLVSVGGLELKTWDLDPTARIVETTMPKIIQIMKQKEAC